MMACETCSAKFTVFLRRKKQCSNCIRYFCSECLIKKLDRHYTCRHCDILSRRPLTRSQVITMRIRDLSAYLDAKKVSMKGCIEKEELVSLVLIYANGPDNQINQNRVEDQRNSYQFMSNSMNIDSGLSTAAQPHSTNSSRVDPINQNNESSVNVSNYSNSYPTTSNNCSHETKNTDSQSEKQVISERNVQIEEVFDIDDSLQEGPEPLITEQEDISEPTTVNQTETSTQIHMCPDKIELSDIKELSELEHLTVQQLKKLLNMNRVDYKGCVEKCELLCKVKILWMDYKKSRKEIENLDQEDLCKICWDAPIECIILECGHMACCISCGKQMSECPICKQYVVRVVRFFKA